MFCGTFRVLLKAQRAGMPSGARRVVFRTAETPVRGPASWGRTGSFAYTNSSQNIERRLPGPPSWRFRRRQHADEGYDGDSSDHDGRGMEGYPAWQQLPRRPISREKQQRLKTEEVNKRLHEQWDACFDDNVFRHTCHQADREALSAALRARLADEFATAARAALPACPSCSQPGLMEIASSEQLVYVALEGRVSVSHPVFRCTGCDGVHTAHPTSFGCFPATPTEPQVCYAVSLLQLTCKVGLVGPLPMEAWCDVLEAMHKWNGCTGSGSSAADSGPQRVWRNLSMAAQQWQRVASSAEDLRRYNITQIGSMGPQQPGHEEAAPASLMTGQPSAHVQSNDESAQGTPGAVALIGDPQTESAEQASVGPFFGPTYQCPCCWLTCQGAMADACMGITHLRAAGRAADSIQPLQQQTPFVEDCTIKDLLVQRRDLDPASLERPTCSEFLAASKGFSDRQARLHMQVSPSDQHLDSCL